MTDIARQNDVDAAVLALRQPDAPLFDGLDDPAWAWAIREGQTIEAEIAAAGGLESWKAKS